MSGLIDTTEMYLRTILELEEEGVVPMRARIAERLDQSGPTVSQTVARMERDGLVSVATDRHLELTDEGRRVRDGIEAKTDQLAMAPWRALGEADCRRLRELVRPLSKAIVGSDGLRGLPTR